MTATMWYLLSCLHGGFGLVVLLGGFLFYLVLCGVVEKYV